MNKKLCFQCGDPAVWIYLPISSRKEEERYFCDNCISRGCSCNINPSSGKEDTDEQGRLFPCCEYQYSEEGYE